MWVAIASVLLVGFLALAGFVWFFLSVLGAFAADEEIVFEEEYDN